MLLDPDDPIRNFRENGIHARIVTGNDISGIAGEGLHLDIIGGKDDLMVGSLYQYVSALISFDEPN